MPYPCLGNEITDADKFLQKKVVHRYGNYLFGTFARLTCSYTKGWRMTRQVYTFCTNTVVPVTSMGLGYCAASL
jgi:hypothetical protein